MKIKWSAIGITNASGTSGGTTFAHNRGGAYARRWAKPVNAQTSRQTAMRSLWGAVAQTWGQLTQEEVNAWNAAGENVTVTDGFGSSHNMTGNTYFMRVNQNRTHGMGQPITRVPLPLVALPNASFDTEIIDLRSSAPSQVAISLSLENGTPGAQITASIGFTIVSPNSNKGYGSVKNKFNQRIRRTVVLNAAGNSTVTIANTDPDLLAILGGASNGSKVYLQVHTHSDAGQKSNPVTGEARLLADSVYTIASDVVEGSEVIEGNTYDFTLFKDGVVQPASSYDLTVTPSAYLDNIDNVDNIKSVTFATGQFPNDIAINLKDLYTSEIFLTVNLLYVEA